jgi:hypothetical protein
LAALILTPLAVAGACTVLLDHNSVQCRTDADCVRFGSHPFCRGSICTSSGFQPPDCFLGSPQTQSDFLNQCSTNFLSDRTGAACLSFDDCDRVGLCSTPADGGTSLTGPPPADGGAAGGAGGAGDAGTAVLSNCRDASAGRGSIVYLTGSSNFPPLLTKLAPIITRLTNGLVPVFRTTDSCTGVRSMYPATHQTDGFIHDPAPGSGGAHAQYFADDGPHDCLLGPAGAEVDIGESEIYPETCGLQPDPVNVAQYPGPILPILFVVPIKSEESAISAAAGHEVFGNGGHVSPWTDPSLFYVRGPGTATTRLIGLAIDVPVPPNKFWGVDQGTAQKLAENLQLVQDPAQARQSIGILGSDFYDRNRANLKALAFQASGQECAYLPDKDLFSKDKINVRDGHYTVWGTLHFFAAVSATSLVSPAAEQFITPLNVSPVSEELLDAFIDSSWVPDCAMKVQRQTEMGPFRTDSPPPYPCGCHFDARVAGMVPTGCTRCTTDADCTAPKPACNFHFCEAR